MDVIAIQAAKTAAKAYADSTFATKDELATKHFPSWASLVHAETWQEAKDRLASWGAANAAGETWGTL